MDAAEAAADETQTPEAPVAPEAEAQEQTQETAPEATEQAEATEAATEAEQKPEEKHKRAGGWQRKIEKLEREREILIQQLNAQRGGQPAPAAKQEEKPAGDQAAEYIDSIVRQRLEAIEAQRQQQAIQAEFARRTAEVRKEHPDFDEAVMSSDATVSPAVQQALLTSEQGPAIMYRLAKNPAELARLNALPPFDAAREIGRLEAQASVTAAPKTAPKAVARKPVPAPITPVTARGSSNVKSVEQMSYEEYTAWRESQRKR
jgi:hypothetical protein